MQDTQDNRPLIIQLGDGRYEVSIGGARAGHVLRKGNKWMIMCNGRQLHGLFETRQDAIEILVRHCESLSSVANSLL